MTASAGAALLAVAVLAGGCAPPQATVAWRGHTLREVRSVTQLPAHIQSSLGVNRPGVEGVADRGRAFNETDVTYQELPMRRFIGAGNDGDTWLIAIERGGRGLSVEVFLFEANSATPREKWAILGRPTSLAEVVSRI